MTGCAAAELTVKGEMCEYIASLPGHLVNLHEFFINPCGSFIYLLLGMYCLGAEGRKRSVWI